MTAPPEPGGTYPLFWRVRKVRPEWFGRRCRIVARGRRMDSRMIEFDNGERVITLGSYLRKWRLTPPDPREGNEPMSETKLSRRAIRARLAKVNRYGITMDGEGYDDPNGQWVKLDDVETALLKGGKRA